MPPSFFPQKNSLLSLVLICLHHCYHSSRRYQVLQAWHTTQVCGVGDGSTHTIYTTHSTTQAAENMWELEMGEGYKCYSLGSISTHNCRYMYWVHMSLVLSTINCRMGWESLGITLYVWSTDRLWEKGESLSLAVIPVSTARLQQTTPNTWLHRRPG